jgi:hypothetical protein
MLQRGGREIDRQWTRPENSGAGKITEFWMVL